jgi:hypothetical protein
MNLYQRIILTIVSYSVIIYAIAYIEVWTNPYWYDNSPRLEYIPVSEWWIWALWGCLAYFIWGLPLLLVAIVLVIHRSKQ